MFIFKKYKDYFLLTGLGLIIFIITMITKNIYPFGTNSIIFSDLEDQVITYYYYLYDAIKNSSSLLVNFNQAGGINFFGIITYYLLSPFSLIILLFNRSNIYLAVSIIIVLKLLLCNITCLWMLKKLFKKLNYLLAIALSLSYGFSLYALCYYQIIGWFDVVYMLPIIVVGVKNLFENKPTLYIISLTLALYFNFYLALMVLIFIFLLSFIYIHVYIPKKERAKSILSLGMSTILSLGSSLVIIIPTYSQISLSSRSNLSIVDILNSKLGPLTDKISLFIFGALIYIGIFLLIKNFKKFKKFLKFYIPTMILLLLPILVEPVNKLLHFGSYASFTYRFGFITILLLIIGSAKYFSEVKIEKDKVSLYKKILSYIISFGSIIIIGLCALYKYQSFDYVMSKLSFSYNKILILFLVLFLLISIISISIIIFINKKFNKTVVNSILFITFGHVFICCLLLFGVTTDQEKTNTTYSNLNSIYNDNFTDLYRYKSNTQNLTHNSNNIISMPSLDHSSSLTNDINQKTLKQLGYSSYWTLTYSRGGTLFSDILLANKYVLDDVDNSNDYQNYDYIKTYNNSINLYEYKNDISYGYLINNDVDDISNYDNTFEYQNAIYESITGQDNLFKIYEIDNTENINIDNNNYEVLNDNNSISYDIDISDESIIYLETYSSLDNYENYDIYNNFNIYINNELYKEEAIEKEDNGIIYLGQYENESIKVEIVFKDSCYLETLAVASMNLTYLNDFVEDNYLDYDIEFNSNKINISINSDEDNKILFIPINNDGNYKAYVNNKEVDILTVYNNFIGIELETGENSIVIKYVPKYLYESLVISIIFIILTLTIIIIKNKLYERILNTKLLQKLAKYIYLTLYVLVILLIFIVPTIYFFISFIK